MAVEHAEAPRRHHEQRRAGEQDLDQLRGQLARIAVVAGGEQVDQRARSEHAGERSGAGDQGEQAADRARDAARVVVAALGAQPGIDRDERRRQHALAE
jgi:hypothetical protein